MELVLGLGARAAGGRLLADGHLWDALCLAYDARVPAGHRA
jgi:hypothetical protein